MRVLVTGAAGLIGSSVAARLAKDHDVIGLDLVPGNQVGVIADCRDVVEWRRPIGKVDAIVHVAALHAPHVGRRSDAEFRRANVESTSRLVEYALQAGASHFVLTSTTSLYGHALEPADEAVWVDEGLAPRPRDIYDETKLEAEQIVAASGSAMIVTSLRMSRCFPEPAERMTWYRLHRGIDRRDVAEAHALALVRTGPAAIYIIAGSTPFRRDDVQLLLHDAPAVIKRRCPGLIDRMQSKDLSPPRSIDRVYDNSLAADELQFVPRYGIEACLADDWDPCPSR